MLIVDAYHEFSEPRPLVQRIRESLAPGGRVAVVEYRATAARSRRQNEDNEYNEENETDTAPDPSWRQPWILDDGVQKPRAEQRNLHHVPAADLIAEWKAGGFELEHRAEYVPRFSTFVFKIATDRKPGRWLARPDLDAETIGGTRAHVYAGAVYLAGKPASADFAALGVYKVVNVEHVDEAEAIEAAGMLYLHVPLDAHLPSLLEALDPVMEEILNAGRDRRVLVHDDGGSETGAIWAGGKLILHGSERH